MAIDINKSAEIVTPFDESEYESLLDEIQGNILKSHGRNHAVHLFLEFPDDKGANKEAIKQWIGRFTHKYVTSALKQAEQAKQHRQKKGPGELFANFFLTRAGYIRLGFLYEDLPNENVFRQGMKDANVQNELGDPPVEQWEKGFQEEIHALVLIASDKIVGPRTDDVKHLEQTNKGELLNQPALLRQKVAAIKEELKLNGIAKVVHEEIGFVLRDLSKHEEIEHFGFRDGVSQPLFLKRDIDKERDHRDFSKWDPRAPLNLILFKDPLGKKEESYGSFLAYRKLEQNVEGWNNDVKNLAKELKVAPALAGAYTMGRFQDGTPVILSKDSNPDSAKDNNFNYAEDLKGSKCPFHAHIRKVNPRGDTGKLLPKKPGVPLEEEKMHRIARRSISYGEPNPSKEPVSGSGLLFLCFQANLTNQFNFMQKTWANAEHFIQRDVGKDPVIGQGQAVEEKYTWPTEWGTSNQARAPFGRWVTMKGGEYFFAPSMSFLKSLALEEPTRNIEFRGFPKQEIKAAQDTIAELQDYKRRNWAIGLNGDTLEPDGFVSFFGERELPFKFYVRSQGVSLGDPSAYDDNIATLNKYIKDVRNQEIDVSQFKIAELEEYERQIPQWAIGLNGDTLEPDGFVSFFGERELPFKFYVRSQGVSLGDPSAYDKNIATLKKYISELST